MGEIQQAEIVAQHFLKEQLCLQRHGPEQQVVEVAVKLRIRDGEVDFAQIEPLTCEVFSEAFGTRCFEHALDLCVQHVGLMQLVFRREGDEFFIRCSGPEEIREALGEREVIQLGMLGLHEEKEVGRGKDELEAIRHCIMEAVVLVELRVHLGYEVLLGLFGHGSAKGTW